MCGAMSTARLSAHNKRSHSSSTITFYMSLRGPTAGGSDATRAWGNECVRHTPYLTDASHPTEQHHRWQVLYSALFALAITLVILLLLRLIVGPLVWGITIAVILVSAGSVWMLYSE